MLESTRPRVRIKSVCACQTRGERNRRYRRAIVRLHNFCLMLTVGLGFVLLSAGTARSQDEVRNFKQPILMVETGGHHGPVRSLIWHDSSAPALLSGGEDKVVKVWDFQTGPRLARTIRPPIWRGPAGRIHALAITKPDAQGQSYLAVGGYGVESRREDLTVFRFPGVARGQDGDGRIPTGEVVARLITPPENAPGQIGHTNAVLCLAFDPSGLVLASGSIDTTVILWDVPAFRPRLVLRGHTCDVRALAFSPNGSRLATTGGDGTIRLWDVATGNPVVQPPPVNPERAVAINTLAFSPDGQSIVVGRESGDIYRFDVRTLGAIAKLPTLPTQGPVEFLAYSPDGRRLAVSIIGKKPDFIDPKTITCDIELREMPAGNLIRSWQVPGLVYALAFSPANDRLAYAGGPAQSILIQELANLETRPKKLEGHGSTPFDLGFTADSQMIGFHRERFDPANPPATYEAFDLARRRFQILPRDQLQRAINSLNGWTMRTDSQSAPSRGSAPERTSMAMRPGHGEGAELVVLFDHSPRPGSSKGDRGSRMRGGNCHLRPRNRTARTRAFAGHGSAVVSVAPSPDGHWLASSSFDQTVMLYPLEGCDVRPGFGATFQQRPDGAWVVAKVEPRGFAAGLGLQSNDVIVRAETLVNNSHAKYAPATMAPLVRLVDDLRPALDTVAIWAQRVVQLPMLGALQLDLPPVQSTKRNNPALTVMPGMDREWVIWTPQGFYDTSIEGDARFLGWHINADFRSIQPSDFVPIGTYAKRMFQPKVLDRLWQTRDVDQAVAQATLPAGTPSPARVAYDERPPRVTFAPIEGGVRLADPGLVLTVNVPNPRLGVNIKAEGSSKIASRRVVSDERALERRAFSNPNLQFPKSCSSNSFPIDGLAWRSRQPMKAAISEPKRLILFTIPLRTPNYRQ